MATAHTPYKLVLHDRPLDTLFNQLPSVFVPSHVTTLGQLSDIAQAYYNLNYIVNKDNSSNNSNNSRPSLVSYHENVGSRSYQQQQLQWRFFYMDIEKLDQELEKMTQQQQYHSSKNTWIEQQQYHRSFLRVLESELIKVYDFYHLKLGEIQRRITYCNSNDPSFMKKAPHKRLIHLESEMKSLPWEIQHLVHFVKTNYRALFMMVYKYDHHLSSSSSRQGKQKTTVLQNQLFRLVASKSFCEPTHLFALISSLSQLYKSTRTNQLRPRASIESWSPTHVDDGDEELRQVPNYTSIYVTNTTTNATTRTAPPRLTTTLLPSTALPPSPATTSDGEEDTSSSASDSENDTDSLNSYSENDHHEMFSIQQFWVHPDNLTEVLLYITKYMDLDSGSTSFPPAQIDTASQRCVQQNTQSTITTLHLDTPDLETYNNRIVSQEEDHDDDDDDDDDDTGKTNKTNHRQREFKSLRMRWYEEDQRDPTVSKPVIAMEEKVYRPSHVHLSSRRRNLEKSPCRTPDGKNKVDPFDKHHYQQQLQQQQYRHGNKEYTRHRLWLKSKNMDPWLSGNWSLKHLLNKPYCLHHRHSIVEQCNNECNDSLLREQIIQLEKYARLKQIQPVLKTMLRRTVFSDHETQLVISIDTEIAIIRHTHGQTDVNRNEDDYRCYNSSSSEGDDYFDHRPPPPKSRISTNEPYPYSSVSSDDMVRFPYAVIKISCPALSHQHYPWLSDLLASPLLEPVNDFSTYAHGVSVLMPEKAQQLPRWLSKMELDISRKGKRGQLLKQQLRSITLERSTSSFDENNLLKLPPTPWSTTSAIYSPTSTNSSSSCISSNNHLSGSTRATTPSSTKGKSVSEEDLSSSAALTAATTSTEIIADERQPLLQNQQHQRPSVGSYCSFDHPSSSRSDPAQCRDCMFRRQSSSLHHTSNSNSRSSSSGSLFSQYNKNTTAVEDEDNKEHTKAFNRWISELIRTLWPTLGDVTTVGYKNSGRHEHEPILPTHSNADILSKDETNSSKTLMMDKENRPNALKMTLICIGSAAAAAFLFYYILSTL
ncbi:VTC domain-containing protein [Phascolomyces articulosus]|uniref:VTC domain-containing protein n=1 Tax=Phascolomyces articulosus TaxID=60185 RepID=A0AAD5JWM0_9FUNG|nr:VTC domain-containing protein [Phascolomyces articulosus]